MNSQVSPDGSVGGTVGLLVVATGPYQRFIPGLVSSARRHLVGLDRVFILADIPPAELDVSVVWLPWGHLPWPYPTLLRYRAFDAYREVLGQVDVLLYVDVDSIFVADLDIRNVSGLLAVDHPGYIGVARADLPYERRNSSVCSVGPDEGDRYFCGGIQGGGASAYLEASSTLAALVQEDVSRGLVPLWHDESAWNRLCVSFPPTMVLGPEHCSPEHVHNPDAVIVALDKDHDSLREVPRLRRHVRRTRRMVGRVSYRMRAGTARVRKLV